MKNKKIIQNAKWIIVCKVAQSLIQLVVGMLSARYLGPANYGLINYAASVVAFAIPIMELGLPDILLREYIETPEQEGQVLGTGLVMNMVAAVACIIGVTSFVAGANSGERITIIVCALYSTSLFFRGIEMVRYWFQVKLLSQYSSLALLGSYVVVSAYKIYLLVTAKSVYWFALSHAVEYGVTGLILLITYKKIGTQKLSFSAALAKRMLSKSKHYILAALMVVSFNSTASILMKLIIGEHENGYYAAALTSISVTQFIYSAIIDSARPVILENKKTDPKQFEVSISRLYCVIIYLSLAQSVFFCTFAELIIRILYGTDYLAGIPVLRIMSWQTAFSCMGSIRNVWILAEEKYSKLWIINLCGAITNVALNIYLIPQSGACGAAVASVLTQFITNFVIGFTMKDIRENNRLLLAGLNPRFAWETLRKLVQTR